MFDIFLRFVEVVWDHLGCVWGVVRGPQEQLSSNIFLKVSFLFKVSGRVQEGPRSPPDPLNNYLFSVESLFFKHNLSIAY